MENFNKNLYEWKKKQVKILLLKNSMIEIKNLFKWI